MIDVAIDAARQGGELANRYFKKGTKVEYKSDRSPVTKADREAEQLIRRMITQKFPDHGIIGEEFPATNPGAKYQWLIDPVDGTRSFALGLPLWTTMIAILENGIPVVAASYFSYTGEVFSAQKSKGTYVEGKRLKVSKIKKLEDAFVINGGIQYFARKNKANNLINICAQARANRGIPDAGYILLLKGKADVIINAHCAIWDVATPSLMVEEAGGRFSDFEGTHTLDSGTEVYTNGILHDQVLKLLNSK